MRRDYRPVTVSRSVILTTRCHDEADSGMLHGSAVGNTSRTGCASSPAAEVCGKIFAFNIERKKVADCCE